MRYDADCDGMEPAPDGCFVHHDDYAITLRCPICNAIMDEQQQTGEYHAQSVAMLGNDGRRQHAKDSPACPRHPDWVLGWVEEKR